ncbi:hypothetical protein BJX76DRAFT_355244 [Aspergillus varians]
MPSRDSLSILITERYPLAVPDLNKAELQSLIEVLAADPPLGDFAYYDNDTEIQIQDAIKRLPSALRRRSSILPLSRALISATALCTMHKGLNQYIISHIFRLIKREVEDHLDLITIWHPEYPGGLHPCLRAAVQYLRSLRGMWWAPDLGHSAPNEAVPPQQNQCEACIISRVITGLEYLKNLSATLQSRTREQCSYRGPPKLSRIVQEALSHRHGESLQSLKASILKISGGLKQARKDAARNRRLHAHGCERDKCIPRHQCNTAPTEEQPYNLDLDSSNPKRRPSSQTIYFCMIQEKTPPFKLTNRLLEEKGVEEEREKQDQLINDILNAYGSLTPKMKTAAAAVIDPSLDHPILPARYENRSPYISPRQSTPAEKSEWEDDWDDRTIILNPGSPVVDRLMDRIGSLLVDKVALAEREPIAAPPSSYQAIKEDDSGPESGPPTRRIMLVPPPGSYYTVEEYPVPKPNRVGSYLDDASEDETVEGQRRKGSETTTWSMMINGAD